MQQLTLVLASLGVFQALFLCVYLLTLKKGNRVANLLLTLLLLGLSIRIGKSIFNHFIEIAPWYRNIGLSGLLLVGPSLWLYGRALTRRIVTFKREWLLHYIPASIYILFGGLIPNQFDLASTISYLLVSLHLLVYLIISANFERTAMRTEASKSIIQWYRSILIGVAVIWSYYITVFIGLVPYYIGGAIVHSGLVYGFSYLMLKRHDFTLEKYSQTKITTQQSHQIVKKLTNTFAQQQTYLNPKLSLNQAAQEIGVSHRELSRAINEHTQQNFSEFVNSFRISHAKARLIADDKPPAKIATIAIESGFSNVTTFNLAFKAAVKLTPSEFRANPQN